MYQYLFVIDDKVIIREIDDTMTPELIKYSSDEYVEYLNKIYMKYGNYVFS